MGAVKRREVHEVDGGTTFIDLEDLRALVSSTMKLNGSSRVVVVQRSNMGGEINPDRITVVGEPL